MSDHERLSDIKEILELHYEKLGEFQKQLAITASVPERFQLKQEIKYQILPYIRRYEAEYWALYPSEAIVISEDQASAQLDLVNKAVSSLENRSTTDYSHELIVLLNEIRALLEDFTKPASAKLKVAIPLIPAIASYEVEMETEGLMSGAWKSIRNIARR